MADLSYPLGHKIKSALESTLQKALELDVILSATHGKLHAAGDRASVAELAPLLRQHRDELVRLLTMPTPAISQQPPAIEAIDQAPPTPKKPLALDPGERALLALAMAFCDRTGVSDKARQDWQRDVADTPAGMRGDLYAHLRQQMPSAPPAPPAAASTRPPAPAKPLPHFHLDQPWRVADRLYQAHHWQCTVCKAAARAAPGTADRCAAGQHLHDNYTSKGHRP